MPPIKRSWNQDLVQEYLDQLNEDMYSRDVIHTAIHNMDWMIDYVLTIAMKDTAKFVLLMRLFEFVDLPFEVQSSQIRIIEAVIKQMNPDWAFDFMCSDGMQKIVFAYKFHHPRLREILERLIDIVIEKGAWFL